MVATEAIAMTQRETSLTVLFDVSHFWTKFSLLFNIYTMINSASVHEIFDLQLFFHKFLLEGGAFYYSKVD